MKAVVVEIENRYAAVLSDDGCIVKVKNNNYEIGQVIQMSNSNIHIRKKLVAIAASAAAMVILGTGTWAYASPYSYVSLDINPSIEFTVNRFDRVLNVKAINDDGEEILKKVNLADLKNETIKEALTITVKQISEEGYFEGNIEAGLVIATSAKKEKKAEELAKELQETVDTELVDTEKDIEVEVFSVGYERVQKAKELGVTPGKLNLIEKLQASAANPETIDIEEWLSKPVKEILKATKANRKSVGVATGSAISLDMDEKAEDTATLSKKEQKEAIKQERKGQKTLEKAEKEERKALERLEKEERKAAEKAEKEAQKAAKKAEVANRKLEQAKKQASEKELEAAEIAAKKAREAANQAKEKEEKLKNKDKHKEDKSANKNKKEDAYQEKKVLDTKEETSKGKENEKSIKNNNENTNKSDPSNKSDHYNKIEKPNINSKEKSNPSNNKSNNKSNSKDKTGNSGNSNKNSNFDNNRSNSKNK